MATSKTKDDTKESTYSAKDAKGWSSAWVSKLLPPKDAKAPQAPLHLVQGFVAESPYEECVRVYSDPCLNHYFDVFIDAIVHREEVPANVSPLGGSYLWLRMDVAERTLTQRASG